jgi:hypothetical protein
MESGLTGKNICMQHIGALVNDIQLTNQISGNDS